MKQTRYIYTLWIAALAAIVLASCSTTRRIPDDELLYTGVKKLQIKGDSAQTVPIGVKDDIKAAINVAPNNSLISPSIRYPFPIGLWVYNNWSNPPKGLKHWLYEKFVEEPVLISDVRPEVRTRMIDEILDNNGYFRGTASYELVQPSNKKKASIVYEVNTGPAYLLDEVRLLPDTCILFHDIDSIAARNTYLRPGSRYCTDSLNVARTNITNILRNRGYYFFRPEFIEYLADSLITPGKIVLQLNVASNTPRFAMQRYRTGKVTVRIFRHDGGGTPDTVEMKRATLVQMMPSRLRRNLIDENITFREGRIFSVRDMNRTQTYLARLGIFSGISINPQVDSANIADRKLNIDIDCTFDSPMEVSLEVNVSSKSNSYLGPGLSLGFTNRNIFGGGEQLNVSLTGSYEWQTGSGHQGSVFNSYEIGATGSLSFPRLLAPGFIPRRHRQINWTRFSLNADLLNRPHYFKMAQFNASMSYDWRASRHVSNTLTLFRLTYTNLLHTTAEFDSIMNVNPAVAQSFMSQYVPQMMYSYTYDRAFGRDNTLNWQFTVQEAGNIFWSIYELCGVKGEKKLFGTPFSQFIKGSTQLVYGHRMAPGEHWLVARVGVGAAHAYGNSTEVPYAEQFYCGGANSVRAFTVRSIGPGSYRTPNDKANNFFDQTGTFKLEANIEYRFPIISLLHGALFLDAGNVWLLKNDPSRPGGNLRTSTFFKDLALGTGFGLRVDIGMLVLRGDLGIGIHAPYDTGKHTYYNMRGFWKSMAFHLAIGYPF